MGEVRHWRRRLKNGDLEFFFDTGNEYGTASGSGSEDWMADHLIEGLAGMAGVEVPEPEWKEPRGKPALADSVTESEDRDG